MTPVFTLSSRLNDSLINYTSALFKVFQGVLTLYGKRMIESQNGRARAAAATRLPRLDKLALGGQPPRLDYTPLDVGTFAMPAKDVKIKQSTVPADILKENCLGRSAPRRRARQHPGTLLKQPSLIDVLLV
ncbi:MAG: hypothetical protein GXN93_03875 [Candidatus Diapherotrites archaeon]|nr:hypothetical protein [Candidatus Diapherotrites archaeon]